MKLNLLFATIILFLVTATGHGVGFQKRVHLQREFQLNPGKEAIVKEAGLKVTFTEVVEDSRCPEGVDCIWAGNGKIRISLKKGRNKAVSFELNTMTEPKSYTYQGYDITLVKLSPYPKINVEVKKQSYLATLKVTRKKP